MWIKCSKENPLSKNAKNAKKGKSNAEFIPLKK